MRSAASPAELTEAVATLYVCYLEVDEPLVSSQVIAYLCGLARQGYAPHLLTFEKVRPTAAQAESTRLRLAGEGIVWHRLPYHKRPSLPATILDILIGAVRAALIGRRHRVRLLHGRSHVGAAMAALAARALAVPFIFDVRGLLADEYVDAGHWRPDGLKYAMTKRAERALLARAPGVVVLTNVLRNDLTQDPSPIRTGARLEVIPCCSDTAAFRRAAPHRDAERRRRGWQDKRVLLHVGKLGGWYLVEEIALLAAEAHRADPRTFLQVVTQSPVDHLTQALSRCELPSTAFAINRCPPKEIPSIATACDAGLSLIKPCYSKRSSSPTKIGEYLAAGLPVISTPGIGDGDEMFAENLLGIIIEPYSASGRALGIKRLQPLLDNPATRQRCMAFAQRSLDVDTVGVPAYLRLYNALLSSTTERRTG